MLELRIELTERIQELEKRNDQLSADLARTEFHLKSADKLLAMRTQGPVFDRPGKIKCAITFDSDFRASGTWRGGEGAGYPKAIVGQGIVIPCDQETLVLAMDAMRKRSKP